MTDTERTTIVAGRPSDPRAQVVSPDPRNRWWAVPLVTLAALILIAIAVSAVLPSELVAEKENTRLGEAQAAPYARTPASAQPVDDRVEFGDELPEGIRQYPPDGDIYFVTVTEPSQSVLSWLVGRDEPAIQFLTEEDVTGFGTRVQQRVLSLESMRSAEQVAQYVALNAVGYDVELVPGDVLIQQMVCLQPNDEGTECLEWSPSDEFLNPGDRLLSIDGTPLEGVEDLTRALEDKQPGDTVELVVDRPEVGQLTLDVPLTSAPSEPERTIVGFIPFDTRRVVLPFELSIDTGRIGGPSAGLAFTLTLIDELTEGELTGGGEVAVTGTMELDGSVGAIGGLRQKASAVSQAGVDVFIVPSAQGDDDIAAAREAGGDDLRIIPVDDLAGALAALESLGGEGIPEGLIATNPGS